jgi:peptide/nickel transport system ATP-binding protein
MTTPLHDLLLEIENLHTHFFTPEGIVKAVDGVSLTIPRGKTVCIVGESGCGKSITARSILQVVESPGKIVGGDIRFHPTFDTTIQLTQLGPFSKELRAIRGKDIAMIFQEPMSALSPLYTIGNQIAEVLRWHMPIDKQEARSLAIAALRRVGIPRPDELIDAYTFELSGGMRQRAMIAMALVSEPKLLIADEPTTALDVTTQAVVLDLMRGLQKDSGMSMLFITHDLGVVADIADEVAVMYLGAVVEHGSVEEVLCEPKHPYTQALLRSLPTLEPRGRSHLEVIGGMVPHPLNRPGGCSFHPRCQFAQPGVCDTVIPEALTIANGRSVRCHAYDSRYQVSLNASQTPPEDAPTVMIPTQDENKKLLVVNDLKIHFPIIKGFFNRTVGHVKAVDGVSFDIYAGETLGLVGESGCGKTTLGQCIVRLHQPTSGEVRYTPHKGEPVDVVLAKGGQLKALWRDIRMIFQDPYSSLNPRLPVLEIIGETLHLNTEMDNTAIEAWVHELLTKVGLRPEYMRRYPHAFSGGERQRISIARALASTPRLVVADEPVSALDVSVRAQILNLMRDLQTEFGLTYLFISHDLSVVAHISDRVAVMYAGKIVELALTTDLFTRPRHPYTEALLSAVLEPDPKQRKSETRIRLEGEVANPANLPSGCAFHPRCRYAQDRCKHEMPLLRDTGTGALVACHFADELNLAGMQSGSIPVLSDASSMTEKS